MIEWFSVTGEFILSVLQAGIKSFVARLFRLKSDEEKAEIFNSSIIVHI
jgi:hypothetical protein